MQRNYSVLFTAAFCCFVVAPPFGISQLVAQEQPIPDDTAILEIAAPPAARIEINGDDYGSQREWKLTSFTPGKRREYNMTIRIGHLQTIRRKLLLRGGERVHLAIADRTTHLPELQPQLGHSKPIACATFSPDGKRIITGGYDNTVILWHADTGHVVRKFKGHATPVTTVAYGPNGKQILAQASNATAIVWNAITGESICTFGEHHPHRHLCDATFSADGRSVFRTVFLTRETGSFVDNHQVLQLDISSGKVIRSFKPEEGREFNHVSVSHNGRWALTSSNFRGHDSRIILWDINSGKKIRTLKTNGNSITSAAFSPDGRWVVAGVVNYSEKAYTALLWDVTSGKIFRVLKGHTDSIASVTISPNGRWCATGSRDKTAILWDVGTGNKVRTLSGHARDISSVAFSPDGRQNPHGVLG